MTSVSAAGVVRPVEAEQGAGLSPALLRTRLSAALKKNGTVDTLKSQLRAKVLSELRSGTGAASASKQMRPVVEQAANYLVMDYLSGGDLRYHICRHRRFTEEVTRKAIAIGLNLFRFLCSVPGLWA